MTVGDRSGPLCVARVWPEHWGERGKKTSGGASFWRDRCLLEMVHPIAAHQNVLLLGPARGNGVKEVSRVGPNLASTIATEAKVRAPLRRLSRVEPGAKALH